MKQVTLKNVLYWIADAIKEVKPTAQQKSGQKIMAPEKPNNENEVDNDKS